jgi:hypothetical protein
MDSPGVTALIVAPTLLVMSFLGAVVTCFGAVTASVTATMKDKHFAKKLYKSFRT